MVFFVDRSRIMQKGGFVEWIWRLVSGSVDGAGRCPPTSEQLPEYLHRLLNRVADKLFLRWSGDDAGWFDVVDWNLKEKLETNGVINWCAQTGVLCPIKINEVSSSESAPTSLNDVLVQSVMRDSSDLNATIEFLHHVISALEKDEQLLSNFQTIKELSILALANLIGQSIVIYCLPGSTNNLAGIYVPSHSTGPQSHKYPLVLTVCGARFVPLLHPKWGYGISETAISVKVPLVTRDLKFITIKSLVRARLLDYDILLDFLDISVKRDKERDNYFFVASTDEGSVLRRCAKQRITAIESPEFNEDNSSNCDVKEYLEQREVEGILNSEKDETNLNCSSLEEYSDTKKVERNSNTKTLETIFNSSIVFSNNVSVLEVNSVKFAKILSNCSPTVKQDSPKVFETRSREIKVIAPYERTVENTSRRFRITEIEVENSPHVDQFQRCLALGCNNLVADKKTFPLCRACSDKQFKIDKGEPEVKVKWNGNHSALNDAIRNRVENSWCH